ncbi:MAG: hypothetical protein Q9M30_03405 [Mariprofundaceae bacterium]|nr:hypothetical protein [Mariprofundaceae bacterium]
MSEDKQADAIAQKSADIASDADIGAEIEEAGPESQTADNEAVRKKTRLGPWLFLLLIFIGLPAAWFLSPTEMRQQAEGVLAQFDALIETPAQHAEKVPAVQPSPSMPGQTGQTAVLAEAQDAVGASDINRAQDAPTLHTNTPVPSYISSSAVSADGHAGTDNAELEAMRAGMARLQQDLSKTLAERDALQSQFQARLQAAVQAARTDGMRTRLQWLARADLSLSQRADLWSEIAARPELGPEDREKAELMLKLAGDYQARVQSWRKALLALAGRIPDQAEADILPRPENQYFAWLVGSFHLRPVSGASDQALANLRRSLLAMEHAMALEDWPDADAWRTLISSLQEQFGEEADSDLPETLQPALRDMDRLRSSAADWLEAL